MTPLRPDRTELAPGLGLSRVVTGLWQVADMERDGPALDPEAACDDLARYVAAGFDTFDLADHYGSAELIIGALSRRRRAEIGRPVSRLHQMVPRTGRHG